MATTLKDLANHLNLSVSCVSRALTGRGRVSKATIEKVLKAAKELNYVPNEAARDLKLGKSSTIGVIVPDLRNVFFVRLIKCIDHALWDKGYSILFCDSDGEIEREREYFNLLCTKNLKGIIVAPAMYSNIYDIIPKGINVVFVDNNPFRDNHQPRKFVGIDNENASYELTEKILEAGHRKIAMIIYSKEESSGAGRIKGFEKCIDDHNISRQDIGIYEVKGIDYFNNGYRIVKQIIAERDVTCIYAYNYIVANGVYQALAELGLKVPDDISIVCFDEGGENQTTIRFNKMIQPIEKIGEAAVEMMFYDHNKHINMVLDYKYVNGDTLKNMNKRGRKKLCN